MLGRSETCQVGHPLGLLNTSVVPADEPQIACARIRLEDLGSAVHRAVIDRNHKVDAGVQMVRDLGVDNVRLVPAPRS